MPNKNIFVTPLKSPTLRLSLRYLIAFITLGVLLTLGQGVTLYQLNEGIRVTHIVGVAARQRRLSQEIVQSALVLDSDMDIAIQQKYKLELSDSVRMWQRSELGLQNGDTGWDLPGGNSREVAQLFTTIQPNFAAMLHAASCLGNQSPNTANLPCNDTLSHYLKTLLDNEPPFLAGMDAVVTQYQKEAQSSLDTLKAVEFLLFGVVLSVLVLEGLFIFRPSVIQMNRLIEQLTRSQNTVRQSEAMYRALAHNFPNGMILLFDHDLRYLVADGQGLASLGLSKEKMEGKTLWEVFDAEGSNQIEPVYRAALAGQTSTAQSVSWNGSHLMQVGPVRDDQNKIIGGIVVGQNITDRIQLEEALRKSQHFASQITQALPDFILVFNLFEERCVYANAGAIKNFGYTFAEIQQMGSKFLAALYHPDDVERRINARNTLLKTASDNDVLEGEYRVKFADGEWHWLHIRDTVFERNAEGEPIGILSIGRDITQSIQTEKALKQSEQRFRQLIRDLQVGVMVQGPQAEILISNNAALTLLGLTEDQLLGKTSFDPDWNVIHENGTNFPGPEHPVPTAIVSRKPVYNIVMGVYRPMSKDRVWLLVNAIPQLMLDDQIEHVVCTFSDITARKKAEQQVLELAIEKERVTLLKNFITDISHDFRTPLSVINSSAYLLGKAQEDTRKTLYLQKLQDSVDHIEKIVADMLTMVNLDSNSTLEVSAVNLGSMLQEIIGALTLLIEDKHLMIEWQLDKAPPIIQVDVQKVQVALLNILRNALQYTAEGGKITLWVYARDTQVVIEIKDSGIGIAADDLPHIFDRLYRADKARSTERSSTGLGLSIAKKVIEEHQGAIEVESTEGQGSLFRVSLPIAIPAQNP